MGKGPGAFSEIGKKAKDLLYRDYFYDQKFSVSTKTDSGVGFVTTGVKKGDELTSDVKADFKVSDVKTEIKVDHKSKVVVSLSKDDLTPGLKATLTGTLPDPKSGKLDLHFKQPLSHLTTSFGLIAQPVVEASVAVGAHGLVAGGEAAYDTAKGIASKYSVGVQLAKSDYVVSAILTDKFDTLKATYLHTLSKKAAIAAEIVHKISKKDITFSAGASYELDPLTLSKVRVNNRGSIAALLQHEFRPKSIITVSGEVDSKNIDKSAKYGVNISFKP